MARAAMQQQLLGERRLAGVGVGQLKVMQEVISLLVFAAFAVLWLGEKLKWNHAAAFMCLVGAVGFMFADRLR